MLIIIFVLIVIIMICDLRNNVGFLNIVNLNNVKIYFLITYRALALIDKFKAAYYSYSNEHTFSCSLML